jgi:hypothetical protein
MAEPVPGHRTPQGFSQVLLAASLALLLGPAWGWAQPIPVSYGDLQIAADPEPEGGGTHGYVEYAFTITNQATRPHTVTLTLPAEVSRASGDHFQAIRGSVEVGPKKKARVSLFQPVSISLGGNDVAVRIDDEPQSRALPLTGRRPEQFDGFKRLDGGLLVLGLAPGQDRLELGGLNLAHHFGGGFGGVRFVSSHLPVNDMSGNWLSYSRYEGVIVRANDLANMPESARTALWQYTECGGTLLVLGKGRLPESWPFLGHNQQLGLTQYRAGFGHCMVVEEANRFDWRDQEVLNLLDGEVRRTASPWGKARTAFQANQAFPVVDDIGIPVRGLFALLVCFGIVIGPVNLGLLARWQRRIWMLWTVPLLSALTCVTVFGYVILAEGWSGHRRTEAITLLDQSSGRATTLGWTGFYSPVTPGDGLRFDSNTELSLQAFHDHYGFEGGSKSFQLDWTAGQHLGKGWVTARVPTHFKLRKSEPRSERITWTEEGGTLRIKNGLGVEIKKFWLADGSGRLHTTGSVEPGATAILTPIGTRIVTRNEESPLRVLYTGDWLGEARKLRTAPDRSLFRWTYLAEVKGSPFVEEGLAGAKMENSSSLVVGILKGGLQ